MKEFLKYLLATVLGIIITGFIGVLLLIGALTAMITMADKPVTVDENTVLMMDFQNQITERSPNNPLAGLPLPYLGSSGKTGLDDILNCIEKAKTDDNIKGIYLNPTEIGAGMATIEEIRQALIDFKTSGKFIVAYGDAFSQKAYYLVSVADQVILNPEGMIELRGLSTSRMFYKNAMEKFGVEMQVIRHGKFKAAVEPYMLDKMSPENRLQTETYLKALWGRMVDAIAESRKITAESVNLQADSVAIFRRPAELVEAGLIDTLMYKDQLIDKLKKLTGTADKDDVKVIGVDKYAKAPAATESKSLIRKKVAVIYAEGEIDGTSGEGIDSDELSRTIREARRDSSIKAIVLRINSPGGSAYGSEVIWREVKLAADTKPLVVSMGDVAASGGYYIAAAADTIMADHTTITGSIGIFGLVPNVGKLLNEKIGITEDVVGTNANSDLLSITRPMTKFERAKMQARIEQGYDTFISRVAEGRGMTKEQVDEIGQGRVWASANAREIGLVDLYGGVNDAIKLAAEMAKLSEYRVTKLPKVKDPFEEMVKTLTGEAKARIMRSELGDQYPVYRQIQQALQARGIQARMPFDLKID